MGSIPEERLDRMIKIILQPRKSYSVQTEVKFRRVDTLGYSQTSKRANDWCELQKLVRQTFGRLKLSTYHGLHQSERMCGM